MREQFVRSSVKDAWIIRIDELGEDEKGIPYQYHVDAEIEDADADPQGTLNKIREHAKVVINNVMDSKEVVKRLALECNRGSRPEWMG